MISLFSKAIEAPLKHTNKREEKKQMLQKYFLFVLVFSL